MTYSFAPAPSQAQPAAGEQALRRYRTLGSRHGGVVILVHYEPNEPGVLQCDGDPLVSVRPLPCSTPVRNPDGFNIRAGEHLADDQSGLEVICAKGGIGTLTFNGRPLRQLAEARMRGTEARGGCAAREPSGWDLFMLASRKGFTK